MLTHRAFALIAIVTFTGVASAQAPKPQAPPAEKLYTLSFDKTPWPEVFEWFSKEIGLTYIDTVKPDGTLTLKSDRKYTLIQVLDLLNEALAQKKLVIIRRSQTFLVHPAGEQVPPEQLSIELPTQDCLASSTVPCEKRCVNRRFLFRRVFRTNR